MRKTPLLFFLLLIALCYIPSLSPKVINDTVLNEAICKNTIIVIDGGIFAYDNMLAEPYTTTLKNYTQTLANLWNWDFYYFCRTINDLEQVRGKNVLLLIDGHGGFYDKTMHLQINGTDIDIMEVAKRINAKNLTVIVNSCYSSNYHFYFHHDNLDRIYTGDRENNSYTIGFSGYIINSTSMEVTWKISGFLAETIAYLYEGYSYGEANKLFWMVQYSNICTSGGNSFSTFSMI